MAAVLDAYSTMIAKVIRVTTRHLWQIGGQKAVPRDVNKQRKATGQSVQA